MLEYTKLGYKPKKTDLVAEYYAEPAKKVSYEYLCEQIAAESSIGTWTTISTMNKNVANKLKPKVFFIDKKKKAIKIAYPQELFEEGNMPQILSSIAGNIFGMGILKNLRLLDVTFPKKLVDSFPGPRYGIAGIRKLLRVKKRPLVGTIVKPKVGLDEKQHAHVAYEAWVGGLDIVKDDENLSSMSFNNFKKRMIETYKARKKAEKITGEVKVYMPNVTAETEEMLRRAKLVDDLGGRYVMIDILTAGWAALQTLRKRTRLVIHAHRAMHAAITRNAKHGISMLVIAKISRLIGVDQLHIGTAHVGKMEGSSREIQLIEEEIEKSYITANEKELILEQDWFDIKPVFAVASGGLSPLSIPDVMDRMGSEIIMQFGGGVHGHPEGTRKGAVAVRQALAATMQEKDLEIFCLANPELSKAIEKWGKKK
ncbi:type III ribulose-bisphosphate carboxylase [Candidatus Woesearchaeota archaeon]|nr:type III ribulose-bisphosphate carboxylase [Candidatus Woesearchaeota archaeon]